MNGIVTIGSYDNYIEAEIAKAKLEDSGIQCTLQNENIVTLNWFYSNATGGIKLCIPREDIAEAMELLGIKPETKEITYCPKCLSEDIKEIHSGGWFFGIVKLLISMLYGFLFLLFYTKRKKVLLDYECLDCGCKFKKEVSF